MRIPVNTAALFCSLTPINETLYGMRGTSGYASTIAAKILVVRQHQLVTMLCDSAFFSRSMCWSPGTNQSFRARPASPICWTQYRAQSAMEFSFGRSLALPIVDRSLRLAVSHRKALASISFPCISHATDRTTRSTKPRRDAAPLVLAFSFDYFLHLKVYTSSSSRITSRSCLIIHITSSFEFRLLRVPVRRTGSTILRTTFPRSITQASATTVKCSAIPCTPVRWASRPLLLLCGCVA